MHEILGKAKTVRKLLDERYELYEQLARKIWDPESLLREVGNA